MTRRLIVMLVMLLVALPLAALAATIDTTIGVAPTVDPARLVGTPDLSIGSAPTVDPARLVGTPDFSIGVPPTVLGTGAPPIPTATASGTPTGTVTTTGTPTGTVTTTGTPTGTATGTATVTGTPCASSTPSGSGTPSGTGTASATATPATAAPCATATATATATVSPPGTSSCTASTTTQPAALVSPALAQKEVVASRTRTSRTYDAGNGKFQTVIGAASLNYQDAQGKWQTIDNTLVAGTTSGVAFQNRANGYSAAFPATLGTNPVSVTHGSQSVSFALTGASGTSTTCANQITYANALPGVTVGYAANSDAVTETLTLASATAPSTYPFAVQTSAGLTARTNSTGGIEFMDSAGKVQFAFSPPTMHDSAKKPTMGKATLQLGTGGTTVTLAADAAWLTDPARVYPVVIDPPVNVTRFATAACMIAADDPTTTNCPDVQVGESRGNANGDDYNHTVMTFDTSIFNANVTITGATVNLGLEEAYNHDGTPYTPPYSPEQMSVHRVTESWDPTCVSWNNRGCNTPWTYAGGTIDVNDGSTITVPDDCGGGWCPWDVTAMVQKWISATQPNYGMRFDDDDVTFLGDNIYFQFYGPDSPSYPPYLTITYNDPGSTGSTGPATGNRPFYTLVGGPIDDRLSVGANVQSGNLLVTASDLTIAGTGLNLAVTRSYNSLTVYKGIFGNHWALNGGPDLRLIFFPNTDDLILQNNTGYRVGFTSNHDGTYQHVPGLDADLHKNGDGAYTLTYHGTELSDHFRPDGLQDAQYDRNSNQIVYTYSGTQLTAITDTVGRTVTFTYDPATGFVASIHDTAGNRTVSYGYLNGYLHTATDANGTVTTYTYDGSGNLTQILDPRTNATGIAYYGGALSRIKDLTRPGLPATHFDYPSGDGTGAGTTTLTDPNGHAVTLTYDQYGEVTHVDAGSGRVADYTYNTNRKITAAKDAYGHETDYQYTAGDPAGAEERVTAVLAPQQANPSLARMQTTTRYTGCTAPTGFYPCTATDAQGNTVRFVYDAKGNRTDLYNDALGFHTHTTFDAQGRVTAQSDANNNPPTTDEYNGPHQELTKIVPPPGTLGTTLFTYDAISRMQSMTDGKGQVTQYTYDTLDRPKTVTYAGNDTVTYTYDDNGNLTDRQEGAGLTHFTYDAANRQVTKAVPGGASITYGYDNASNLTSVQDGGGTVAYAYNQWNLVDHLTEPNGAVTSFGYDNNNAHTTTTYPGGTTQTLTYDNSERLTQISAVANPPGGPTVRLTQYTYAYANGASDTALRQSVVDGVANATTAYAYDGLNRLVGATATGGQPSSYQYGYDLNGNRTSTTIGGLGTSASFNAANEQTSWSIGLPTPRTYTYDGNGNETGSSQGESRGYNSRDQTTSITGLNGTLNPIGYLDGGQAERTSAGGSTYVNSSEGIASETKVGGTTYYTRTPSGHLVGQRSPGPVGVTNHYYYLFDGLGSVVGLVDASGNLVARYGYDPYGQTITKTGTAADENPWRYTGAYLDSTGLYKMGARYYDPARGRFTQLDPAGTGYVYANDNPVNFTDPSGLNGISVISGGGIIITTGANNGNLNTTNFGNGFGNFESTFRFDQTYPYDLYRGPQVGGPYDGAYTVIEVNCVRCSARPDAPAGYYERIEQTWYDREGGEVIGYADRDTTVPCIPDPGDHIG